MSAFEKGDSRGGPDVGGNNGAVVGAFPRKAAGVAASDFPARPGEFFSVSVFFSLASVCPLVGEARIGAPEVEGRSGGMVAQRMLGSRKSRVAESRALLFFSRVPM